MHRYKEHCKLQVGLKGGGKIKGHQEMIKAPVAFSYFFFFLEGKIGCCVSEQHTQDAHQTMERIEKGNNNDASCQHRIFREKNLCIAFVEALCKKTYYTVALFQGKIKVGIWRDVPACVPSAEWFRWFRARV